MNYPNSSFKLCIDSTTTHDLCGRAYTNLSQKAINFSSYADLLITFDELFDLNGVIQSTVDKRTFSTRKTVARFSIDPTTYEHDFTQYQGKVATYWINIRSREHTSWQGAILDENYNMISAFSSEIELLKIIKI